MQKKKETQSFGFHAVTLIAVLVGFSLILGSTPSYGQTQKALIDLNTASEKELESIKGVGPATAKKIIEGRPYKSVDDLSKAGISAKTIEGMKPFVKVGPPPIPAATPAPGKPAATTTPAKEPTKTAPTKASPPAAKETPSKAAPTPTPAASTPAPQKAPTPAATAEKAPAKTVAPAKLGPGQKVNINTATKEQLEALPEIGPVKAQAIIDGRPYKTPEDIMKVKGIKEGTFNKIRDSITVN
jgi:competence protein ComEA